MKIGLVFDDSLDRPDGVQQYVGIVGGWLAAQGHEVHYLVGETARTDLPHLHSLAKNIGVTFNGNRLTIPLPAKKAPIRRLLEQEKFDILHVQMPYSPMFAKRVIQAAPRSTVVVGTFHILPQTWLVQASTHVLGWWLRRSLRRFDRIVAVSSAAQRFAEKAFHVGGVSVLPNVITLSQFNQAKPLLPEGPPIIMFLGRLVPRKGCATLLDALALLHKDGVDFRAVICGKGPLLDSLQAQADRLGIKEKVSFAGFIAEADKPGYLASATVAAFPSLGGESFGIVLAEAMGAQNPLVLAASNPGYATVLEPRPELLFKPGDHQELAEKLRHYLSDQADRQAAVDWQREYVKGFDIATVGPQLLQLYNEELQKKLQP